MPRQTAQRPKAARSPARGKADTLEDNIGVRIMRIAEVFTRLSKQRVEEPWGVRATELRVINFLDGKASVAINELARGIHVDKAWISRSVGQLVGKGLVERRSDPDDARVSSVALTKRGQALLDDMRPHAQWHERRLLKGTDGRQLKSQLDRLLANAEAILDERPRR
jgi:DNA-binding MarR family transcriptional regulator